jgi:molybdate transport system substrate-binding protein
VIAALVAVFFSSAPACATGEAPAPGADAASNQPIKVAAASDLAKAFEEVGVAFEKTGGAKVIFAFGSTGNFAKQLREGAPFDVFAAANVSFVDDVVQAGKCDGATKALYARGRIVLFGKKSESPPAKLEELREERIVKIAIANPEHAPYGKAAKQALTKANLWDEVSKKIVNAENVLGTFQFVKSGNAEAGIGALSLAMTMGDVSYVLIDEALHDPLEQALVVCTGGKNAEGGGRFAAFVNGPEGRSIMRRFGFTLPGEPAPK